MRRLVFLVAALSLVVAACATGPEPAAEPADPVAPSASPEGDARPVAPDFTLALGDGGTFTLSEEARPVYMIFWAEW